MKAITALTADPKQNIKIVLDDGTTASLTLEFVASQRGWFYSITRTGWTGVSRRRLVNSPNILRQFRGVIPFGFMCAVLDGQEPVYQDDFSTGRVQLYVLDQADLATMETYIQS